VKNGKVVWSESFVEVAALDRKQKWTITLQWRIVFATKTNTFATRLFSFALCIISLRSAMLFFPRGGKWFPTDKITLQTNCETDFQQNKRSRGIFL